MLGAVSRLDGRIEQADIDAFAVAHVEAVKYHLVDTTSAINNYYSVLQVEAGDTMAPTIQDAYCKGMRRFILHKHPNSNRHGFGVYWRRGKDFGDWFKEATEKLDEYFPEAEWGFPAMRLGGDLGLHQADSEDFFEDALEGVNAADFVELENRWENRRGMRLALWRIDSYWRFIDKPFVVTFCNPKHIVRKETKAEQYVEFYKRLRVRGDILAAFCFCVSSSDFAYRYVTWRGEESKQAGIIPKTMGKEL